MPRISVQGFSLLPVKQRVTTRWENPTLAKTINTITSISIIGDIYGYYHNSDIP